MATGIGPKEASAVEGKGLSAASRYPAYGSTPSSQSFVGNDPVSTPTQSRPVLIPIPYLPEKSLCEAYLLCLPFGFLGFHHFYLRRYWFGFLYFFTGGLVGVGWIVDIFRLPWLVREENRKMKRLPSEEIPQVTLADAYLLWFPLGILGLHHYYLRRPIWGLAYTLSAGLFGIGWILDACRIPSLVRNTNERLRLEHFQEAATPSAFRVNLCDTYVLCLVPPMGILGAHHFYMRRYAAGLFYFFTLGGCGIGWIVDWFRLKCLVDRCNHPERYPLGRSQKFVDEAYVYAFPMGLLGIHHFYLERPVWGFLYFFTGGLFGIGWLVDLCRMPCLVKDANWRTQNRFALMTAAASAAAAVNAPLPHSAPFYGFIVPHQGAPAGAAAAYVENASNYGNNYGNAAAFYPPPYQPLLQPVASDNRSWVSVTSPQQQSLQSQPPGPSAGPPAYSRCAEDNNFYQNA